MTKSFSGFHKLARSSTSFLLLVAVSISALSLTQASPSSCQQDDFTIPMSSLVQKTVQQLFPVVRRPHWVGDGFFVRPLFGQLAFSPKLSPFLMFDYAEPKEFPKTTSKLGVGMHPHRGFETVTIALQGEIEHQDSFGHSGIIGTGEVQWMTAGSGIFHEEFHSRKFAKDGGKLEMMQLWVNLPKKLKMTTPRYQGVTKDMIPEGALPNDAGSIHVIAGDYKDIKGGANTDFADDNGNDLGRGHIDMWRLELNEGKEVELPVPEGHTVILFVRTGAVTVAEDTELTQYRLALMTRKGESVKLKASEKASLVLLAGAPCLDDKGEVEPIEAYGPMVMNTREEIADAMQWARGEQMKMYRR